MITKSIRLTEEQARSLAEYVGMVGGTEASILKEAALRGLREVRISRAVAAFTEGASSHEASLIAALPRAIFLHELMARGVHVLREAGSVQAEVEAILAAETAAKAELQAEEAEA